MFTILSLLAICTLWYKKSISLPKLDFNLSSKRGIPVSTFHSFEKQGFKVNLGLDTKYFETCLDLKICPEFLKFKAPNLSMYKNDKELYQVVVRKKLKRNSKRTENC